MRRSLSEQHLFELNERRFDETAENHSETVYAHEHASYKDCEVDGRESERFLRSLDEENQENQVDHIRRVVHSGKGDPEPTGQNVVDEPGVSEDTHEDQNSDEDAPEKSERGVVHGCRPHTHLTHPVSRRVAALQTQNTQSETQCPDSTQ